MNKAPPGYYLPLETVTEDDHTAWILIWAALGSVVSIIFFGFRVFCRRTLGRNFVDDDLTLLAATVSLSISTNEGTLA